MGRRIGSRLDSNSFPCFGSRYVRIAVICWVLILCRPALQGLIGPRVSGQVTGPAREADTSPAMGELDKALSEDELVYVVPIHETIEPGLLHMVERGIEMAKKDGADLLVLDMDTPGGRVDSAVDIKNLLLNVRREMHTATFVNPEAISAGALLALSTEKIYMVEEGHIGDAAPITLIPGGGMTGEGETPEKIVSYVRSQFISAADTIGYPTAAAAAMVDKDFPFPPYSQKGKLLTLYSKQAVECGIAVKIVPDLDTAIAELGYQYAERKFVSETWSESIARFLTNPIITGLLMIIGIIAIGIEIYTPGIGYPALIGVISFAIVFWGHSVAGLAGYTTFLIFLVGVVLLAVEIFLIPGFGVVGVSGLILIFVSLVLAISDRLPPTHELFDLRDLKSPLLQVCISFLAGTAGLVVIGFFIPKTGFFRNRLVLSTQPMELMTPAEVSIAGREGTADSDLRPSGIALIGNDRVQVVTQGEYIEKGTPIRVLRMEGQRVIVEKKE